MSELSFLDKMTTWDSDSLMGSYHPDRRQRKERHSGLLEDRVGREVKVLSASGKTSKRKGNNNLRIQRTLIYQEHP